MGTFILHLSESYMYEQKNGLYHELLSISH
jgi:hypothetical protein